MGPLKKLLGESSPGLEYKSRKGISEGIKRIKGIIETLHKRHMEIGLVTIGRLLSIQRNIRGSIFG